METLDVSRCYGCPFVNLACGRIATAQARLDAHISREPCDLMDLTAPLDPVMDIVPREDEMESQQLFYQRVARDLDILDDDIRYQQELLRDGMDNCREGPRPEKRFKHFGQTILRCTSPFGKMFEPKPWRPHHAHLFYPSLTTIRRGPSGGLRNSRT